MKNSLISLASSPLKYVPKRVKASPASLPSTFYQIPLLSFIGPQAFEPVGIAVGAVIVEIPAAERENFVQIELHKPAQDG